MLCRRRAKVCKRLDGPIQRKEWRDTKCDLLLFFVVGTDEVVTRVSTRFTAQVCGGLGGRTPSPVRARILHDIRASL